jgi:hypothetical protein
VVGSSTAVGSTAITPLSFSATGDLLIESSMTVDGSLGATTFSLLADTDHTSTGILAFKVNTAAGIASTTGVDSINLSGYDLRIDTTPTAIVAGAAKVFIYQSAIASSSIVVGGTTLHADNSGVLYINSLELSSITTTTGYITIGGSTTVSIDINAMSYTASAAQLIFLSGVVSVSPYGIGSITTGAITVTTASSSTATLTTMMSSNLITFTGSFTATGASGLLVIADVGCTPVNTGVVTIGSGATVSTLGSVTGPIAITGTDLVFVDATAFIKAAVGVTITDLCSSIEVGGVLTSSAITTGNMRVDSGELAAISCTTLTFTPKAVSGTISVVATITDVNTAGITDLVTLDASAAAAITFSAASTWASSLVANSADVITVAVASPIITDAGVLTLSSTKATTTGAISVRSCSC